MIKGMAPRRVTRRTTLNLIWLPVGAAAGRMLPGCADDAGGMSPMGAADGPGPVAPADPGPTPAGSPAPAPMTGTPGPSAMPTSPTPAPGPGTMPADMMDPDAGVAMMPADSGTGPAMDPTMMDPTESADVPWASGGTGAMQGNYPDPFGSGAGGASCTVYPSQTLGPCYANGPAMREDISDGMTGLPTRLSFKVVRGGCEPISGAEVDIWHCGYDGYYSAFAQRTICNPEGPDVMADMFCRGVQVTGEDGQAHFNSVFPGWYSGRAVHIHFTVRVPGMGEVTSQLYFEDDLVTDIHSQGEYAVRGMRSTLNSGDRIFSSGGASPDDVTMSTARRPDGVLHAWKILSIG